MTKSLALLIALVVLVLGGMVFATYWFMHQRDARYARTAHRDFLREVRLARAAGISLDRNSLKSPLPPPAEDAGPIYDQIAAELKANPIDEKPLDAIRLDKAHYPPTATEVSQARAMLQKHSKLLSLIHQAVGRKQGVVRINWEGKEMLFSPSLHVTLISKAARVLKAESMVLAQEGHVREAVQNQALAFRCADHLQSGRSVLYAIVGCGTNATTLRGMREILYLHGDDPQIAQSVLEAVRENAHTPNITSAMRADATISFFTLDYFRSINPKFVIPDATPQSGRWRLPKAPTSKEQQNAYIDASEAAILHRQRLDILASEHPYLEAKRLFAANQSEWIKSRSDRTDMANGMGDDESGYVAMAGADNASINVVEIAARLLIWKSQHGGFPSKLSAIGDTPLDPFSGKSFGYRREGSGFVLYSVGEGGNFEGGSPNVKPKASLPMFRYPVPAYYRLPANLGKTP